MSALGWALATGVLHVVVVAVVVGPLIWWRSRRRREPVLDAGGWRTLVAAVAIYLGAIAVLHLPRVGFFAELAWNWQNKLLLLVVLVAVVTLSPSLSWWDVGARRPRARWWIPVLAIVTGAAPSSSSRRRASW
jgi:uncharacterized protein